MRGSCARPPCQYQPPPGCVCCWSVDRQITHAETQTAARHLVRALFVILKDSALPCRLNFFGCTKLLPSARNRGPQCRRPSSRGYATWVCSNVPWGTDVPWTASLDRTAGLIKIPANNPSQGSSLEAWQSGNRYQGSFKVARPM